jgi:hypothetical protein
VPRKFVSPSDPAAQWTGAMRGQAFFAYADNYLIDVKFGVIMDVEATRAIRLAELGAAKTMIERTEERFGISPSGSPPIRPTAQRPRWIGSSTQGDRAPYPGLRQIEAQGRHALTRGLHLGQEEQRLSARPARR